MRSELTDAQWRRIRRWLPPAAAMGRPRADDRQILNGILWVLRSGARWQDVPRQYGSPTTCWRRLVTWQTTGVWTRIWQALLRSLDTQQRLSWSQAFLDGSFVPAKKGGVESASAIAARARSAHSSSSATAFRWPSAWRRPKTTTCAGPSRLSSRSGSCNRTAAPAPASRSSRRIKAMTAAPCASGCGAEGLGRAFRCGPIRIAGVSAAGPRSRGGWSGSAGAWSAALPGCRLSAA